MFRTRLTLTQLEQRETPSDITPVDPGGGSTTTDPTQPVQTSPTDPTQDPTGTP